MASIAIVVMSSEGHVRPTLQTARALVARGHRVTYFCTARYGDIIRATGAALVAYETTFVDGQAFARTPATAGEFPVRMLAECAHVLPQITGPLDALAPDLVLYDRMTLAGRVAAARGRVPAIMYCPSYAAGSSSSAKPIFGAVGADDPARRRFAEIAAGIAAETGLPPMKMGDLFGHAEPLNLVFLPAALQPDAERFGDRFLFVGAQVELERDEPRWTAPGGARPVLFVSLGTIFHDSPAFYRKVIAAFAGSPWHVVMAIGSRVDAASLGDIPSNFELGARLHLIDVLRGATAFISNAGLGSVIEALYHGVPVAAAPQMAEQRTTAGRLGELGVGTTLADDVTPAAMRGAVERLAFDPGVQSRVGVLRDTIVASNGPALAVAAIERVLVAGAAAS